MDTKNASPIGLLQAMDAKLSTKPSPPVRHGSITSYLGLNSGSPLQSCLSLSCSSLAPLCSSLPVPLSLATTRDQPLLARHFLLRLWQMDRSKEAGPELLGYTAIFQFYLDFYALTVTRDGGEVAPEFPAQSKTECCYRTEMFDYRNEKWAGWRTVEDVRASLQLSYWTDHPLAGGKEGWQCYPEDREMWGEAAKVLESVEEVGMVEVVRLGGVMSQCSTRLDSLHKQFIGGLTSQQGKGCCLVM